MAYRAGATLMDMEMVQYHPTTLARKGFLITEGARGEGAHLLNAKGERFMERYAPNKMELASRDVVSRAEQTEIEEGRGFPDGTVALDITVVPRKRIHEALREIVLVGRDFAGVDITREPIHIKPGNHYMMGGVKTDVHGPTSIPGLYAAGEVACVSVHGGNRLGANSLLDTLIFGRRSGEHAAARAKRIEPPRGARAVARRRERANRRDPRARGDDGGRRVAEIRHEMSVEMDRNVGVFRDEEGIQAALETVQRLKEDVKSVYVDDHSRGLQPGRAGRARARVHARQRRVHLRRRPAPHREPRRPDPHRLPGPKRRGVAQAHQSLPGRRRARDLLLGRHDHPVAAGGADLLGVEANGGLHAQGSPVPARGVTDEGEPEGPFWEDFEVDLEETLSVLDGLLHARSNDDGSLAVRCSCRAAICGSCGVKVNGQSALACKTQLSTRTTRRTGPRARTGAAAAAASPSRSWSSRWATCR